MRPDDMLEILWDRGIRDSGQLRAEIARVEAELAAMRRVLEVLTTPANGRRNQRQPRSRSTRSITREEERRMIAAAQGGDIEARNGLLEGLQGLIVTKVRQFCNGKAGLFIAEGDLVQECTVACIGAIEKFDLSLGVRLSTYAGRRILGAMQDFMREESKRGFGRFNPRKGERPKLEQIHTRRDYRLDGRQDFHENEPPDHRPPASIQELQGREQADDLVARLRGRGLTAERAEMLRLYYCDGWTMKQIAEHVGCSESRVSQIFSYELKRLKNRLKKGETL